jgi:hypothetical protein
MHIRITLFDKADNYLATLSITLPKDPPVIVKYDGRYFVWRNVEQCYKESDMYVIPNHFLPIACPSENIPDLRKSGCSVTLEGTDREVDDIAQKAVDKYFEDNLNVTFDGAAESAAKAIRSTYIEKLVNRYRASAK